MKCTSALCAFALLAYTSSFVDHEHDCPNRASGNGELSAVARLVGDVASITRQLTDHVPVSRKDQSPIRFRVRVIPPNNYAHDKKMNFSTYEKTPDVFKIQSFINAPDSDSQLGTRNVLRGDSEFGLIRLILEDFFGGEFFHEMSMSVQSDQFLLTYGIGTESNCTLIYSDPSDKPTLPRLAFSLSLDTRKYGTCCIEYGNSLYDTLLHFSKSISSVLDLVIKVDVIKYVAGKSTEVRPSSAIKIINEEGKWNIEKDLDENTSNSDSNSSDKPEVDIDRKEEQANDDGEFLFNHFLR